MKPSQSTDNNGYHYKIADNKLQTLASTAIQVQMMQHSARCCLFKNSENGNKSYHFTGQGRLATANQKA